jgi:hypothetical protein
MFLVIFSISCEKSTDPIETDKPPPGYQEDIPWPSLANSPWPMAHHDPQNTGRSKLWGPTQGIISWEFDEAYKMMNGVVVGYDSTAYILIPPANGGLFAFNPDGTLKWNLNILTVSHLFTSPIITADGTIFCYDGNKIVHAVDPEGTVKYSFNLESATHTPTFAIDKVGNFYYIDENATLYVIDQEGNVQWTLQDDRFNNYRSTYPSFSPDGNTLYIISGPPALSAVDIKSKEIRWSIQSNDLPELPNFIPAIGVIVGAYGNIYCLNRIDNEEAELLALRPNGEIKWRYKVKSSNLSVQANIPTIDRYGNVYCATDSLYSIDFDGNLKWKKDLSNNISDCPLICDDNGSIYIGAIGAQMSLIAFDSDGNQLWKIDDNQNGVGGSPAIGFNEFIYFPTWESNKLYGIK